jgi:DNA invertase Pin-like site-specific DNA recombinase
MDSIISHSIDSQSVADGQTKSERIRSGLDRARAQGKRIGRPPVIVSPELARESFERLSGRIRDFGKAMETGGSRG